MRHVISHIVGHIIIHKITLFGCDRWWWCGWSGSSTTKGRIVCRTHRAQVSHVLHLHSVCCFLLIYSTRETLKHII